MKHFKITESITNFMGRNFNMNFDFTIRVSGSAKGTVIAKDKKEAKELIQGGQWEEIDIDVEDVIEVEHLKESI